jgi:hypothetical protein
MVVTFRTGDIYIHICHTPCALYMNALRTENVSLRQYFPIQDFRSWV